MATRRLILRGAALSGGSVFLSMFALLAVGKIATNALTPAEVAVFALVLLASDGLNLLATLGLPVALPRLIAAAPATACRVTRGALAVTGAAALAASMLLAALWLLLPAPVPAGDWHAAWPSLWWAAPLLLGGALRDTAMAALAGYNRYGARARGIVFSAVAQVALAGALVLAWGGGLDGLLFAVAGAQVLAVAALLWPLRKAMRRAGGEGVDAEASASPEPREGEGVTLAALRFSAPLYANSLLNFVFQRVDTLLLAVLLGDPVPVAIFEMAKRLPMVLSRGLGALLVPFLPAMSARLASGDSAAAARLLDRALGLAAFVGFTATFAGVLLQEAIILALFSPDYLPATAVLGPLLGVMVVAVLTGLFGQTLIALGRPGQVTAINVATAGVSLGLNVLLIPHWGLAGAVGAALGAVTLSYGLQAIAVRRAGIRVRHAVAVVPLLLAGAAGLVLVGTGAPMPLRAAALVAIAAGLAITGGIRPAELLDAFRRHPRA